MSSSGVQFYPQRIEKFLAAGVQFPQAFDTSTMSKVK
jgi:hypothetical protein